MVPSMICFVLHIEVDIDLVTKTILALLGLASGIYTFLNARLQSKVLNKQLKNLSSHEEEKDE